MTTHRAVQDALYDYATNTLAPEEQATIERHLEHCDECRSELNGLRELLHLIPTRELSPDTERYDTYWQNFAGSVTDAIGNSKPRHRFDPAGWVDSLFHFEPRYVYAAAGVFVFLVALTTFLINRNAPRQDIAAHQPERVTPPTQQAIDSGFTSARELRGIPVQRVNQYFRKSKMLLVGLTNFRPVDGENVDLSTERRVSRDLIHEARYLRDQPIDPRSRRLMKDLEVILIELENLEGKENLPNVEIIRSGIRRENLLFKIRLAETMYDSTQFVVAGNQYTREETP